MSVRQRTAAAVAALMGVSGYERVGLEIGYPDVDDAAIEAIRKARGGNLNLLPVTRMRWYMRDIETAEQQADAGNMTMCGQIMRSARKDGVYLGVMSTRTDGLVRLPRKFFGSDKVIAELERSVNQTRSVFDEMFPKSELALLAADGIEIGVGIAEMVPVPSRGYPVMIRHAPEYLFYRADINRWFLRTTVGLLPIYPGDGRWILHMPGGRQNPWQNGIWRAIAKAYIRKEHAGMYNDNWLAKLANSARVASSPQGANEKQREGFLDQVMAWGVNTVFSLTPGWEVKLLESNGRGYQSYEETAKRADSEIKIAVTGNTVTVDGGKGFQNNDIFETIRADLIQKTGDDLAHTINTQGLPQYILDNFGQDALEDGAAVIWDTKRPADKNTEANAMTAVATSIERLTQALATHGLGIDVKTYATNLGILVTDKPNEISEKADLEEVLELAARAKLQPTAESVSALAQKLGINLEPIPPGASQPRKIELAPTDIAKVVRAKEARSSQGLEPFGDERDDKTVYELGENAESQGKQDIEKVKAEEQPATEEPKGDNANEQAQP